MVEIRPASVLFLILATAGPLLAQSGVPQGPEFRVNTYVLFDQNYPAMARDSMGNFVIAWESGFEDGSYRGIFAQRYNSGGAPLGVEFRVNTYTLLEQDYPSVASDSAGNFVIAWISHNIVPPFVSDVFAQRYASTGTPLGGEFRVNTLAGSNHHPSVASDSAGNFVVAWTGVEYGNTTAVVSRRFASTGAPLGTEFRVNTFTTSGQGNPAIAADSAGNFVIAWESQYQDGSGIGVFAQRYASTGAPLGAEFRVNTFTTSSQMSPAIACDSAGNFVIAWESPKQDGSGQGIFAQRFAATGSALGAEFQVNLTTTYDQSRPSVASDSAGNFTVVWEGNPDLGPNADVFGQRYTNTGIPLGGEFRVNTFTPNGQLQAVVATDLAGNFVVAWTSYIEDGHLGGVFAQRYSMMVPVKLQTFVVE
jgi:hypothetical protein